MNRSILKISTVVLICLITALFMSSQVSLSFAEQSSSETTSDTAVSGDENTEPTPIVFYVKDEGSDTNDGLSDKTAFATMTRAYEALSDNGGTVVVCGKLSLYDQNSSLPTHEKEISITSYYDGVDYRNKKDAEICYKDTLNIFGPAKTYIYGVNLHSETTANIFCNGSSVEFGEKVDNITDTGTYPSVWGGRMLNSSNITADGNFSDYTVEIDAGYWHHVTLGNLRSDMNAPISMIKNARLNINGGTFVSTDSDEYTCSLVSGSDVSGSLTLDITGGIYYGSLYIIGNEGQISPVRNCRYTADINVSISNGSFLGKYIKALYNKNAALYGTYNFSALSGSYSSLNYVSCEGVYSDITLVSCDSVQNKLYGFEKVVFVSPSSGNDENSGENPTSPKQTLSGAITSLINGGTVVICSEIKLPDGFIMTHNDKKINLTTRYNEIDYAQTNGAKLVLEGNIYLQSSIGFNNITLQSPSSSTFFCKGYDTSFDENIITNGDVGIVLEHSTETQKLTVKSGNFSLVEFCGSDVLTYFTLLGGNIELVRFTENVHNGDIFFDLSAGTINNSIDMSGMSIGGCIQIILSQTSLGSTITAPASSDKIIHEALVILDQNRQKLVGFEFIEDKYVFIKDGGIGDGSTPGLSAPSIDSALSYLGHLNASVIVCGPYTHNNTNTDIISGILTFTSHYRNLDFASVSDAYIELNSDFYFKNDATIKDITVVTKKPNMSFRCNSHIVIFGYGIKCNPLFLGTDYYPSIISAEGIPTAPYNEKGESLSDKITIMGGTWNNVYASASTHLYGSVIKGSLFGTEDLSNNCTITVSNGVIYGGIYASKNMKSNARASITITFTGGEIHGTISPSQSPSSGYLGRYTINISGGDFFGVEKIVDASYVGGTDSRVNIDTEYQQTLPTDQVIKYQNPISTKKSSLHFYDGYWYLFEINADIIYVYRHISIQGIRSLDVYTTIETGGENLDLSVSFTNGKLYIFAQNIFNGELRTRIYTSKKSDSLVSFIFVSDITFRAISSPCLYFDEGENYLYFSQSNTEGGADIFCVKLKDDLTFGTEPVRVLSATSKWEYNTLSTPRILSAPDGNLYLCYTAGNIYGGSSMIGLAQIINKKDLLNEASYIKDSDPAFYENDEYKNLLLSDLVCIENREPYLVYSAKRNGEAMLIMQSFSYDASSKPYFSDPCDISTIYLAHYTPIALNDKISAFKINVSDEVPSQSIIKDKFTLSSLSAEHLLIIICGSLGMLLIIAVVLIKKLIHSPSRKLNNSQRDRTMTDRRHSSRRSGRLYASYLENNARNSQEKNPMETEPVIADNIDQTETVFNEEITKNDDDISDTFKKDENTEQISENAENIMPVGSCLDSSKDEFSQESVNTPTLRKRPRPKRRI